MYKFCDSYKVGKAGESKVIAWFNCLRSVEEIFDVSEEECLREEGIDFFVEFKNGNVESFEVKTDQRVETGNMFLEIIANNNKNKRGCLLSSKADFLVYYFVNGSLYMLPLSKLQKWIRKNLNNFKQRSSKNPGYHSVGLVVPIRVLLKELDHRHYNIGELEEELVG